jgi:hypothetical protein
MVRRRTAPTFWVTNICNRNVSLSDLNLTIKAFSSVNLLDSKHYYYTEEQLLKSAQSGSLLAKSNKIVVRKMAPIVIKESMPIDRTASIPTRQRSVYEIKNEVYEELSVSDEEFALNSVEMEENADKKDTK